MSRLSREIYWTAIIVGIGMFLFPPIGTIETYGRTSPRGYTFLFSEFYDLTIDYWRLTFQLFIVFAIAYMLVKILESDQSREVNFKRGIALFRVILGFAIIGGFGLARVSHTVESDRKAILRQEEEELARPRELPKKVLSRDAILSCQIRYVGDEAELKIMMESASGVQTILDEHISIDIVFEDSDGFEVYTLVVILSSGSIKVVGETEFLQLNDKMFMQKEPFKSITDWTVRFDQESK